MHHTPQLIILPRQDAIPHTHTLRPLPPHPRPCTAHPTRSPNKRHPFCPPKHRTTPPPRLVARSASLFPPKSPGHESCVPIGASDSELVSTHAKMWSTWLATALAASLVGTIDHTAAVPIRRQVDDGAPDGPPGLFINMGAPKGKGQPDLWPWDFDDVRPPPVSQQPRPFA
jgi:hypothetical protein